jgi:hypothetical protein
MAQFGRLGHQIKFANEKFLNVSDVHHYAEGVAESVGRTPDQRRMNQGASEEEQHWYCHLRYRVSLRNSNVLYFTAFANISRLDRVRV